MKTMKKQAAVQDMLLQVPGFVVVRCVTEGYRSEAEAFVNANHSYIQWADRPSRKLYWLLYEHGRQVGVFGLGSAYAKPKAVAEWMEREVVAFNELGNNIVYCLYGQTDRNAGTRFLKLLRTDAKVWWKELYGDDLKGLQTFILPPRTGAMYLADNWQQIGITKGGVVLRTKTLYGRERTEHENVEIRTFKNGEVKYLCRYRVPGEQKLIFVRRV